MAFTCGAKLAKGILISYNLVFWLSGCALIALGVYTSIADEKTTLFPLFLSEENSHDLHSLSYGFIAIGLLVFTVGFFGCFGAIREHKTMIIAYFVFLFIILVSELTVGILAVTFQHKSEAKMESTLKLALKKHYGVDGQTTRALDLAQTKVTEAFLSHSKTHTLNISFECCGILNPGEYIDSAWSKNEGSGKVVPPTCCTRKHTENPEEDLVYVNESLCQREEEFNEMFRHQRGCLPKLRDFLKKESSLFIGVGCGIAALQVFGMIFSICLCREIP